MEESFNYNNNVTSDRGGELIMLHMTEEGEL
jgi:hypothetical protein